MLGKIWYFIWKDDSIWSWLANVIIAVVLVKFIIYPGLGFLLNTSFPVVAVVSCSMEHGATNCGDSSKKPELCSIEDVEVRGFDDYWNYCGGWYEFNNITKEAFNGFRFKNGFNKGDIMVLYGVDMEDIKMGDVIVFGVNFRSDPIIHRVVDKNAVIMTKGDHNSDQNGFEKNIKKDMVLGKAVIRIPYLGWVKVVFNEFIGG